MVIAKPHSHALVDSLDVSWRAYVLGVIHGHPWCPPHWMKPKDMIWYGCQEAYSGPWFGIEYTMIYQHVYIPFHLFVYNIYIYIYICIALNVFLSVYNLYVHIYIYILIFMYISWSQFSTHSVQSDLNFQLLHLRPCWKTPSPTKSGSISSCTLRRSGRRRNSFSRPSRWEQMWRWALKATVDLVGPSVFLLKKCGLDLQLMCCWSFFLLRSTPILLQCS